MIRLSKAGVARCSAGMSCHAARSVESPIHACIADELHMSFSGVLSRSHQGIEPTMFFIVF